MGGKSSGDLGDLLGILGIYWEYHVFVNKGYVVSWWLIKESETWAISGNDDEKRGPICWPLPFTVPGDISCLKRSACCVSEIPSGSADIMF